VIKPVLPGVSSVSHGSSGLLNEGMAKIARDPIASRKADKNPCGPPSTRPMADRLE
jgi:hypothetical protein